MIGCRRAENRILLEAQGRRSCRRVCSPCVACAESRVWLDWNMHVSQAWVYAEVDRCERVGRVMEGKIEWRGDIRMKTCSFWGVTKTISYNTPNSKNYQPHLPTMSQLIKAEPIPSVAELMYMYDSDSPFPSEVDDLAFPYSNTSDSYFTYPTVDFSTAPTSHSSLSPDPSTPGDDEETTLKDFISYNPNPSAHDNIQRAGTRKDRRRQQNRLAQKKYRARKERLISDLQGELDGLKRERDAAMQLNARLMMEIRTLRYAFMPAGSDQVAVQGMYDGP